MSHVGSEAVSSNADQVLSLITRLASRGVRLWLEDDALRYVCSGDTLGNDDMAALRADRDAVKRTLAREGCTYHALPASQGQRSLWFAQSMLGSADPSYHLLSAITLDVAVTAVDIETALAHALEAHDVLRCRYVFQVGTLWQRLVPAWRPEVRSIQVGPEREELNTAIESFAAEAFDLENGPVFRAAVIDSDGTDGRVFVFCAHHIAMDFGSMQRLMLQLSQGIVQGIADVAPQYSRFVARQIRQLHAPSFPEALQAAAVGLTPLPAPLELQRPSSDAAPGVRYLSLDWNATGARASLINATASRLGMTTFGVCFGLFAMILGRLCSQRRTCIHIAASIQSFEDGDALGNFTNLVPALIDFDEAWSCGQALQAIYAHCQAALERRDIAFPVLVDALGASGTSLRTPLSSVAFSWHRETPRARLASGALGQILPASRQIGPPGSLLFTGRDSLGSFDFKLTYDTTEVAEAFAKAIALGFDRLLDALSDEAVQPMSSIGLALPANLPPRPVIHTSPSVASHPTVLAAIHAVARTQEQTIAVIAEDGQLSYRQLLARATQVAAELISRGVAPGDRVAVHHRRDITLIPALLGVLMAGAVYVPIDRSYPVARVERILALCRPKVALIDSPSTFSTELGIQTWNPSEAYEGHDVNLPSIDTDALAYIIFTSGSTGTPKGVAVEHGSLAALAVSLGERLGIAPGSRYLAVSSITFDASIAEIFMPLASGATLVLGGEGLARDADALQGAIARHHITDMQATPTTWKALLGAHPDRSWHLHAHSMGEALPTRLVSAMQPRFRSVTNLYGPTEATVYVTANRVDDTLHQELPMAAVSQPLPGCSLWILDSQKQPVATGVVGELYLSGVHVAQGYWDDPSTTQAAFALLPHLGKDRFYRTGDLARDLGNGHVEIVGRRDSQLKLRGYRIEPGEVEAALLSQQGVQNAAVVVVSRGAVASLEAFVEQVALASPVNLLASLREALPHYMVPARIHALDRLPVNSNGKVDRIRLRDLALLEDEPISSPSAAIGATPRLLLEVLGGVLGRKVGDPHANVFDLGADSLTAVEFVVALRKRMSISLAITDLFEHPVIADLARLIDAGMDSTECRSYASDLLLEHGYVRNSATAVAEAPQSILLTGATGYLGSRILPALLATAGMKVVCLVRPGTQGADARLRSALRRYSVALSDEQWGRVEVLPATLGSTRFGLDELDYLRLAQRVGAVVHSAALVNFALPYASMRSNVTSTLDVVRFCSEGQTKALHFVSTYSVLDPRVASIGEDVAVSDHDLLDFGYARSKWVCEQLIQRAGTAGLDCRIYRPSRIVSAVPGEALNSTDFYSLVLAGSVAAGVAPDNAGVDNFVAVASVARRIAESALESFQGVQAINLCADDWTSWSSVLRLLEKAGVTMQALPYQEWLRRVAEVASETQTLRPFLDMMPFLEGSADRLRTVLEKRHPDIQTSHPKHLRMGVRFDEVLIDDHLQQIRSAFGIVVPAASATYAERSV